MHVAIGIPADALTRDLDEVRAEAVGQRLLGAGGHAAGHVLLAALNLIVAHGALHHARGQRIAILVRGDVERAGHHAVAAAHAHRRVVGDRAVGVLGEGVHEAHRGAGRFLAVVALHLAEHRTILAAVLVHDRISLLIRAALVVQQGEIGEGLGRGRQLVHLVAPGLALAAAAAARLVEQDALGLGIAVEGVCRGLRFGGGAQGCRDPRGAQQAEKLSSLHGRAP